jgi:hypothetical protein
MGACLGILRGEWRVPLWLLQVYSSSFGARTDVFKTIDDVYPIMYNTCIQAHLATILDPALGAHCR